MATRKIIITATDEDSILLDRVEIEVDPKIGVISIKQGFDIHATGELGIGTGD